MKRCYSTVKNSLLFFGALAAMAMLFIMNSTVKQSASDALSLCFGTLIPSLFPALAVTSFLSRTGVPAPISKIIFFPLRLFTGAPDAAAPCFLLGQTAGYPAGVKSAAALFRQRVLSQKQAQNAALLNVNPGLPFSILVVGKSLAENTLTGVSLYFSAVFANLLLSFFFRKAFQSGEPENSRDAAAKDFPDLLVCAVEDACEGTLHICAWIVAFAVFTAPAARLPALSPFSVLFETTNAAAICTADRNFPLCAFSMSFGGLCLMFQLLPDLKEMGVSAYKYLLCRLFCGISAFAFQTIVQRIFPVVAPAANMPRPVFRVTGGSYLSCAALLTMCAVFMLSVISEKPVKGKKMT